MQIYQGSTLLSLAPFRHPGKGKQGNTPAIQQWLATLAFLLFFFHFLVCLKLKVDEQNDVISAIMLWLFLYVCISVLSCIWLAGFHFAACYARRWSRMCFFSTRRASSSMFRCSWIYWVPGMVQEVLSCPSMQPYFTFEFIWIGFQPQKKLRFEGTWLILLLCKKNSALQERTWVASWLFGCQVGKHCTEAVSVSIA